MYVSIFSFQSGRIINHTRGVQSVSPAGCTAMYRTLAVTVRIYLYWTEPNRIEVKWRRMNVSIPQCLSLNLKTHKISFFSNKSSAACNCIYIIFSLAHVFLYIFQQHFYLEIIFSFYFFIFPDCWLAVTCVVRNVRNLSSHYVFLLPSAIGESYYLVFD